MLEFGMTLERTQGYGDNDGTEETCRKPGEPAFIYLGPASYALEADADCN